MLEHTVTPGALRPTAKRIGVAGFQHETNTFAPGFATFEEFEKHDGWPGLTLDTAVADIVAGMNLPVSGFMDHMQAQGHVLLPILWCSAEPSGYVTEDAFERIAGLICQGLVERAPLDAVYLDLHGAMVTQHFQDAEGELLRRIRAVVGPDLPVVASLDLHANVSPAMVAHSSALLIYRTYPHLDMAKTGARSARLLDTLLSGRRLHKAYRQSPYLVPLSAQCTDLEPCRARYRGLTELAQNGDLSVDLAMGFPPADIHDAGPALVVYGEQAESVERAADTLLAAFMAAESKFENTLLSPDEAVGLAIADDSGRTVVLADVQDNPGAGAVSDTVGILEALVRLGAQGAVMGIVHDPDVAAYAHAAGLGAMIEAGLGGKSGVAGVAPFVGKFRVEALGDGRFDCTGEMYRGTRTELGPMALLQVDQAGCDVGVIVGSVRFQCLDQAIFRHLGVEPAQQRIVVLKSTVHFRADFDPIAGRIVLVESPGANPCRLLNLDYRNLRPGVRLEPLGPSHG